jgi:class 3 adenylate cyclase
MTRAENVVPIIICCSSVVRKETESRLVWAVPALSLLLLVLLSVLLAQTLFVKPVIRLADGLSEVARGNLNVRFAIDSGDEYEEIARECMVMTSGLIEKARMEQYVSAELLDEIRNSSEAELRPGGERLEAAVVFAMLKSDNADRSSTNGLTSLYNLFFSISNTICSQNGGTVDKIIGNTIMLVFREQKGLENHAIRACNAVIQIANALETAQTEEKLFLAAGLSCGSVISGKIGSRNGKLDYTVIGDVVNMAARLKAHAAMFSENTIICSETMTAIESELFCLKPEAEIRIKGKSQRCRIFRLMTKA